ncbi:hypothetical protein EJB05_22227 [Eragrostis curvula]|uniref:Uncharacterized protein n=1 Tax=Eragrostis curvula TaxID=38414 RepID=A0A5J9V599_9POAL|nr:hypothetical protein EJB05_22227 [Eragrostis curvula]
MVTCPSRIQLFPHLISAIPLRCAHIYCLQPSLECTLPRQGFGLKTFLFKPNS